MTRGPIKYHRLLTVDFSHARYFKSFGASAIQVSDPDMVQYFVHPLFTLLFVSTASILLTLTWYVRIMLAYAEENERVSLGVTLCQYTASCMVHCFLTVMVFMVL